MEPASNRAAIAEQGKPSFWLLHWFGWLGYVILFTLDNTFLVGSFNQIGINVVLPLFLSALIAAILTIPLRYIYQRCWHFKSHRLLTLILVCSLVVALLWTPMKNTIVWKFVDHYDVLKAIEGHTDDDFSILMLFMTISYSFVMVLVWSSLYFSINFYYRLLSEKEQHLVAVRLSHSAQIKMLRYQINPHFLFNTLNAISTLVLKGSKDKANGMLTRLSTFLRFSLDNDPEKKIRLYEELKALMLYLEIEKTRFDERLSVRFEVEPRTESLLVPSLLLQPLVENCIKYAISKMAVGGIVEITAKLTNNLLHLEVADNGPDAEIALDPKRRTARSPGSGVGLRNIQERLMVLYPDSYRFSMRKNNPYGLRVVIEIPIEES